MYKVDTPKKKPWYKRWKVWGYTFAALIVIGMLVPDPPEVEPEVAVAVEKPKESALVAEARAAKKKTDEAAVVKMVAESDAKAEADADVKKSEVVPMKKNQIEALFKRDPDEKVYEDSSFITRKGQFTADYIMYVGDESVPYVSAIFYGDDLANISLETKLSNDDIEELLGVTFNEETRKSIKRRAANVEINFDKRFADDNIISFPFELD